MFSQQQLEQIFKMLHASSFKDSDNIEDSPFSGIINISKIFTKSNEWIVDYRASDHMTAVNPPNMGSEDLVVTLKSQQIKPG